MNFLLPTTAMLGMSSATNVNFKDAATCKSTLQAYNDNIIRNHFLPPNIKILTPAFQSWENMAKLYGNVAHGPTEFSKTGSTSQCSETHTVVCDFIDPNDSVSTHSRDFWDNQVMPKLDPLIAWYNQSNPTIPSGGIPTTLNAVCSCIPDGSQIDWNACHLSTDLAAQPMLESQQCAAP